MKQHANGNQTINGKGAKLFRRDFTLVVLGQIISLFGNAVLRFALPLYILEVSGSEAVFGLVSAVSFLPMIIMSPIGGIVVDRVNKQRIMVVLDFLTAALILGFMLLMGRVAFIPLVVAMLMLLYGIQGAYTPAVQASLPLLVEGEALVPANAVINLVQSFSGLLGPVLGGLLYGVYGLTPILVVGGGCFFFSAVMELFIRIPHTPQTGKQSIWAIVKSDMAISTQFLFREMPIMVHVILIIFSFNLVMSAMLVIGMPILITKTLGMSSQLYGVAQGVMAAGGLAGGLVTGVLGKKLRIQQAWVLLLICGLGLVPMGLGLFAPIAMVSYGIILYITFQLMACATMFTIQMLAFVQAQTPAHIVGKVVSFLMAISICAQPIGQAVYGLLFQKLQGAPWAIILGAACLSVCIALYSKSTFAKLNAQSV